MLPFIPWKWLPGTDHQPTLPKLACCQPTLSRFLGGERSCPSIGSLPPSPGPLPPPDSHPCFLLPCLMHSLFYAFAIFHLNHSGQGTGSRRFPLAKRIPRTPRWKFEATHSLTWASLLVFHSCWLLHKSSATRTCLRWLQGLSCLLSLGLCSCHCPGSFCLPAAHLSPKCTCVIHLLSLSLYIVWNSFNNKSYVLVSYKIHWLV